MDILHGQISTLAEQLADTDLCAAFETFERAAYEAAGRAAPPRLGHEKMLPPPPRLTEDWFC
jgi:hypothetical protein